MSISLITFIIIHLGVFAFMVEMLRRLAIRHHEYPLEENRETLPFGFLRLRHIVVMFIISYVAWVIFSLWLYQLFIGDLL
ncbi:MAG: hypothetical protein V1880_02345 [Patescibacteria group bacterium]